MQSCQCPIFIGLHSLHGGSLEITLTVPLIVIFKVMISIELERVNPDWNKFSKKCETTTYFGTSSTPNKF